MRTYAECIGCGGDIVLRAALTEAGPTGPDVWFHVWREDWVNNVHPAEPRPGSERQGARQ